MRKLSHAMLSQHERNINLIGNCRYMREKVESKVLPLQIDIAAKSELTDEEIAGLQALEIDAARTSVSSLASLAKIGELDHLGGGLGIIPVLTMAVSMCDYEKVEFTLENAHCSIGYYSTLSAFGFVEKDSVIDEFRRGLDIPGHVSWVPGGTQLNGGRLGIMIPVAVGQALGKKAHYGDGSWVVCSCGDAGWVSGQALNGWNAADLHGAPITFVMDRNGIQLSGSNKEIMDKDPRIMVEAMGIEIIEVKDLFDTKELFAAMKKGFELAQQGRPNMIYPVGQDMTLKALGEKYNITSDIESFCSEQNVNINKEVWVPGSLMSYRDIEPMLECIFLVNELPGGKGHHDGSMKGRDEAEVLGNPMLQLSDAQQAALEKLQQASPRVVVTEARPAPGSQNLVVDDEVAAAIELPGTEKPVSARAGVQKGYEMIAKAHPESVYVVSCDLDPSTKLDKAKAAIADDHKFELSIEEQVATLIANGLSMSGQTPSFPVVSTFAAFFEGIAREGMELWRYQRNLNGVNEGLNVCMHMSHVGSNTGRDHFSGWSLDWINVAIGYLPYLHRFYSPADARSAFIATRDAAANYGAHIVAIPRDNLPILADENGEPIFKNTDKWEPVTALRKSEGADKAILALGATAYLAIEAVSELDGVDAHVVNGLPLNDDQLDALFDQYKGGIVTVEDGLIGNKMSGLRGFAGLVSSNAYDSGLPLAHVGIVDPRIAPADGHDEVWEHFGLTTNAVVSAVRSL